MTTHLRFEFGTGAVTELEALACQISIGRGLKPSGVTSELDPGVITAVVKGATTSDPRTNPHMRPNQPVRLLAGIDPGTGVEWHEIFTGTTHRAQIDYSATDKKDASVYWITVTGVDLCGALASLPYSVATSGTLTQRLSVMLTEHGIPFTITDTADPETTTGPLPTDGKTVADQLRLIRDTAHALVYVDKTGVLQAVADNARPRTVATPDHVATDETGDGEIHYHDITPVFDTEALVNRLTVTKLTGGDPEVTTYTDATSETTWGTHPGEVTVNDGLAETHAGLYLATRTDPETVPRSLSFAVDTWEADDYATHLAAACALEIGHTVEVRRDGLPTTTRVVRYLSHAIDVVSEPVYRLRWTVTVDLDTPEVLPTRWDDVPPDLTWDDVPPDLTWSDAVGWHPYL